MSQAKSATRLALCIIADEVLNGKTLDTNSNYVAKRAFMEGFRTTTIRVIPDCDAEIQKTILELSGSNDIVFTSGGIGPTHDDLTYPSIAKAFSQPLKFREEIAIRMKEIGNLKALNDGQMRMCTVPEASSLMYTKNLWQPIVKIKNVYIFPGVPSLFHRMIDSWFEQEASKFQRYPMHRISIRTEMKESAISPSLTKFHEAALKINCSIGSYPKLNLDTGVSWVEISMVGPKSSLQDMEKIVEDMIVEFEAKRLESKYGQD